MKKDYTYAVARIRARETQLLSSQVLEQLMAAGTYEDVLRLLADKGWGYSDDELTADAMLTAETQKTWDLISELTDDMSTFDVFCISDDYHNLKAAIKLAYTKHNIEPDRLFLPGGNIDPEIIKRAAQDRDYSKLPEAMAVTAKEAQDTLLHTGDGQLCDIMIDRAALEAIYAAGKKAEHEVLAQYAELTVAASDIKIAVRCGKTGKPYDFILRALADCDELDTQALARAAMNGTDSICEYLQKTCYSAAAAALKKSPAAFECWCDDLIIESIKPQKYNPFTAGPLAAYILARLNEIKCVRLILSGKQNGLPDEVIRERLREMYV